MNILRSERVSASLLLAAAVLGLLLANLPTGPALLDLRDAHLAVPFTSLDPGLRKRILDAMPKALTPGGVALVIQYSPLIQAELRRLFTSVRRRISLLNVPPAFLFACSQDAARGSDD